MQTSFFFFFFSFEAVQALSIIKEKKDDIIVFMYKLNYIHKIFWDVYYCNNKLIKPTYRYIKSYVFFFFFAYRVPWKRSSEN